MSAPRAEDGAATTVGELLARPSLTPLLTLVAGSRGLDRRVDHPRVQKSGLGLVGHMRGISRTRVQILGETEISFLETLDPETRAARVQAFLDLGLCAVVITRGIEAPPEITEAAERTGTPLVVAAERSSATINAVHRVLDDLLAPRASVHGVLVDIHAVGLLILGPSGIGKSECALFLVERGHRFVADDLVELRRGPDGQVHGRPSEVLRHHLEVRGLGILNVRDLFGATAVREEATVDLVVELCRWSDDGVYERLGLDEPTMDLLGVPVPKLDIPVNAGRDMGVLLEVAARNQLLKRAGLHGARRFAGELAERMGLATDGVAPPGDLGGDRPEGAGR